MDNLSEIHALNYKYLKLIRCIPKDKLSTLLNLSSMMASEISKLTNDGLLKLSLTNQLLIVIDSELLGINNDSDDNQNHIIYNHNPL
ncbi:flagellar transcriptional regulator FlhD [Escherichia coli]|nr:flagellar transcriptional regulator FlhD [Escherichia coli]